MNLEYAVATVAELVVVAVEQLQRRRPDSIDSVVRPRLLVVAGQLVAVPDATQLNNIYMRKCFNLECFPLRFRKIPHPQNF